MSSRRKRSPYKYRSGFRKKKLTSCQAILTYPTDSQCTAINGNELVGSAFLNVSTVTDSYRMAPFSGSWTNSFYFLNLLVHGLHPACRTAGSMPLNPVTSEERFITSGILQESILGPMVFSMYLLDLNANDGTLTTMADTVEKTEQVLKQEYWNENQLKLANIQALWIHFFAVFTWFFLHHVQIIIAIMIILEPWNESYEQDVKVFCCSFVVWT